MKDWEKIVKNMQDDVKMPEEVKEKYEQTLDNLPEKKVRKINKISMLAAGVAMALIIGIPTGTYAAKKYNWFESFFGEGVDTAPIEQYVKEAGDKDNSTEATSNTAKVNEQKYEKLSSTFELKVNKFMYNEATSYGIVQFTIKNLTGDGRKCFSIATPKLEEGVERGDLNACEIYTGDENELIMDVVGLKNPDTYVYLDKEQSNDNYFVCQMLFVDFEKTSIKNANLKLCVRDYDSSSNLYADIPIGDSIPSYKWTNVDGFNEIILSPIDYYIGREMKNSKGEYIKEKFDVKVLLKNGKEYRIIDDKTHNVFFGILDEDGLWDSYTNIIDLDDMEAIIIDGKEYKVSDAVRK